MQLAIYPRVRREGRRDVDRLVLDAIVVHVDRAARLLAALRHRVDELQRALRLGVLEEAIAILVKVRPEDRRVRLVEERQVEVPLAKVGRRSMRVRRE